MVVRGVVIVMAMVMIVMVMVRHGCLGTFFCWGGIERNLAGSGIIPLFPAKGNSSLDTRTKQKHHINPGDITFP
jgi:hypothetical protein